MNYPYSCLLLLHKKKKNMSCIFSTSDLNLKRLPSVVEIYMWSYISDFYCITIECLMYQNKNLCKIC